MQNFKDICRRCGYSRLTDRILPDNFCVLAFHSIYPYMVTLANGGWFNWIAYDEHVIVNCPSPDGIAMYVKKPYSHSPDKIEIEVMESSGDCSRGYKVGDKFIFNLDKKNSASFKILDESISLIFEEKRDSLIR